MMVMINHSLCLFLFVVLGNVCWGNVLKDNAAYNADILTQLKRELRQELLLEIRQEIKTEVAAQLKLAEKKNVEGTSEYVVDKRSDHTEKKDLVSLVTEIVQSEIKNGICKGIRDTITSAKGELTHTKCAPCRNDRSQISPSSQHGKRKTSTAIKRGSSNALLDAVMMKSPRAAQVSQVAFSVYLDQIMDHIPLLTIIKFNRIDINDANAYNNFTGVFTAPASGVYMFHFEFIGNTRITELRLVVDSRIAATALTSHDSTVNQSVKASSTTLTRVRAGQSVWIETYVHADANIIAASGDKSTSFMGVLLY